MLSRLRVKHSSTKLGLSAKNVERVTGIEPAWPAWKAGALPLSYTRMWCLEAKDTGSVSEA